jgi:hypothetical protein
VTVTALDAVRWRTLLALADTLIPEDEFPSASAAGFRAFVERNAAALNAVVARSLVGIDALTATLPILFWTTFAPTGPQWGAAGKRAFAHAYRHTLVVMGLSPCVRSAARLPTRCRPDSIGPERVGWARTPPRRSPTRMVESRPRESVRRRWIAAPDHRWLQSGAHHHGECVSNRGRYRAARWSRPMTKGAAHLRSAGRCDKFDVDEDA